MTSIWHTLHAWWQATARSASDILPSDPNIRYSFLALVVALLALAVNIIFDVLGLPSVFEAVRARREHRRFTGGLVCRVRAFKPARIVNAYGVRGFSEYWPITSDPEIDTALRERSHVLLVGRPHVGKSRAAIHHIRQNFGGWFHRWYIIHPYPTSVDQMRSVQLPKRRYVLLLDDLDMYVHSDKAAGVGVLELIQALREQAKELVVIGTVRRTLPEFESLALNPQLLGRWKNIEILDWSFQRGADLAKALLTDVSSWDGTPLSIIQPSALMAERYRTSTAQEKRALRALKLCTYFRMFFVPRQLFLQVCTLSDLDLGASDIVDTQVIQSLYGKGFLSQAGEAIQAYTTYLNFIADWSITPAMGASLQATLVAYGWPRQLLALSWFRMQNGDSSGAREACEAAVRLDPANPNYRYRLGVVLLRSHMYDLAAARFKEAIEISPDWQAAWYRLARSLQEQGLHTQSAGAFRHARSLGSPDAKIRLQCAELLRLEGRLDEAAEESAEAVSLDPQSAEAWHCYGRALREESRWKEAAEAHEKAIALRPDWEEAYFGLGEPLLRMGKKRAAEEAYRKAIQM